MRLFIALIIIALFLQTSFIPVNICILLLICRSLVVPDRLNLILGFVAGLSLGFLSSVNLGFYAIVFLVIVELTRLVNKLPVLARFWAVAPVTLGVLLFLSGTERLFLHKSTNFGLLIFECLLSIPVFLFIRFHQGYFAGASDKIKLRP